MFGLQTVGGVIVNVLNYFLWKKVLLSFSVLLCVEKCKSCQSGAQLLNLPTKWAARQVSSWDTPQGGDVGASHRCMGSYSSSTRSSLVSLTLAKKFKSKLRKYKR